jgi:hypothetical protein
MYKCVKCNKNFQNKRRTKKLKEELFEEYVWGRQTYSDLAKKHGRSEKWVQIKLDETEVGSRIKVDAKELVIVGDVTFFSRTKGLAVFREPNLKQNVWWKFTPYERVDVYVRGRNHLEENGFKIKAIVLDGKRGVREAFRDIPVQMCHFHQKQIIQRYLTNNPKLEPGKELKEIARILSKTTEEEFKEVLDKWHEKWKSFLKEKTTNPETGKWFYTHKRLRSTYRSLRTNLSYLFTYQKYPELQIPNTTNSLDGYFNVLKSKLNVHRGLSNKRAKKVIVELLKGKN